MPAESKWTEYSRVPAYRGEFPRRGSFQPRDLQPSSTPASEQYTTWRRSQQCPELSLRLSVTLEFYFPLDRHTPTTMHLIIGDDTAFVVSILLILSLLAPARITLVAMLSFTTQLGALRSRYIFSKTRKFTEAPVTENKVLTTYTLQHRYSTSTPNFGDSPTFFLPIATQAGTAHCTSIPLISARAFFLSFFILRLWLVSPSAWFGRGHTLWRNELPSMSGWGRLILSWSPATSPRVIIPEVESFTRQPEPFELLRGLPPYKAGSKGFARSLFPNEHVRFTTQQS